MSKLSHTYQVDRTEGRVVTIGRTGRVCIAGTRQQVTVSSRGVARHIRSGLLHVTVPAGSGPLLARCHDKDVPVVVQVTATGRFRRRRQVLVTHASNAPTIGGPAPAP